MSVPSFFAWELLENRNVGFSVIQTDCQGMVRMFAGNQVWVSPRKISASRREHLLVEAADGDGYSQRLSSSVLEGEYRGDCWMPEKKDGKGVGRGLPGERMRCGSPVVCKGVIGS